MEQLLNIIKESVDVVMDVVEFLVALIGLLYLWIMAIIHMT